MLRRIGTVCQQRVNESPIRPNNMLVVEVRPARAHRPTELRAPTPGKQPPSFKLQASMRRYLGVLDVAQGLVRPERTSGTCLEVDKLIAPTTLLHFWHYGMHHASVSSTLSWHMQHRGSVAVPLPSRGRFARRSPLRLAPPRPAVCCSLILAHRSLTT